jgi:hypothetical protein
MAAENWSPPISKTFEQIVYFSTSVTGYQTKKSGQWGQCYKTNTAIIYCHFKLNYHSNFYNIEFTLEWL